MDDAAVHRLDADGFLRASVFAGQEVPRRDWHFEGWMPSRTVTLLTGDGGTGKSTLALQLAVATATGTAWLGQTMAPGRVIVMAAEDDEDELHRRLDQICIGLGLGLDTLDDLHLWPMADQDAVMGVEARDGRIEATDRWFELLAAARAVKPSLVILDSLADIYGGNENIRSQVRQFVALMRRLAIMTGGAVLALSHPSLAGMSSGSGSSGSTAWSNSVRSRIYLTKPDDPDADPDLRVLSLKKSNYARAQADMRLRREAGGFVLVGGAQSSSLDA
jgi:RecA-family ATPase